MTSHLCSALASGSSTSARERVGDAWRGEQPKGVTRFAAVPDDMMHFASVPSSDKVKTCFSSAAGRFGDVGGRSEVVAGPSDGVAAHRYREAGRRDSVASSPEEMTR